MEKINKIETKGSSLKKLEVITQSKEYIDEVIKSTKNEVISEKELPMRLGTYEEAPKFIQDNEYLKNGYLLNCNTFKKILKSFLMLHNESVNILSHLLGAIFFFLLIWYTTFFITNSKTQISNIRTYVSLVANKAKELNKKNPSIMNNIYKSMKEIELKN